ncbi:HD domain-containing protein [Methanosarcina sp. UBA411]|uniref:HD domain-containing protein n=1 Tax=Methanosarcina sp. UBA411 TaxID=1915589 RepID=UPI0025FCD04D|nr:HD domain-containing protein [Methanosarcina sp. UBA411]
MNSDDGSSENGQSGEGAFPEPLPLEDLYHIYGIERSHADNVARNALELFDILNSIHGLHPEMRNLVEIAALVHDTGVATDFENHHKAGRLILLLHPPSEIPERLWPVISWTAFLHKKRIGNDKLEKLKGKDFGKMPEDLQDLTLKVAALVRLADALDYSRMESRLGKVTFGKRKITFDIKGQGAKIDAERMTKKGDLWHLLYDIRLDFRPAPKK